MRYSQKCEPQVSTNRQIVLIRVEEVVQVVDGHHQVCLVDQAGGGHAVVSSPPLSICTKILTVNVKRSGVKFFFIRVTPKIYIYILIPAFFFDSPDWLQFTLPLSQFRREISF